MTLKNIVPKTLRGKMIVLTILIVTMPILVSGYVTKTKAEESLLKEKQEKLFGATKILDEHLTRNFSQILQDHNASHADRQTQIKILNDELRDFTDLVANAYPGIGVGYYSKELDAIVTYGPSEEYEGKVGMSIEPNHPGNTVQKTGESRVEFGPLVRGNIMNAMLPISRNGEVIGYIWANELTDNIHSQLIAMDQTIFLYTSMGMVLIIILIITLSGGIVRDVNKVKTGLQKMRFNLKTSIQGVTGEIGEISSAINEMADSLLNARTLTENVMESIEDGVITVDNQGNIMSLNHAATTLTGFSLDEVLGKPYIETLFKGVQFNSLLLDTLTTGKNHICVEMDYPVNDKMLYVSASTTQLKDGYDKTIGAVVIFKDLTEKRQLIEQIKRADRLAALGELMAGVAHEIRNPLTGIKSFVQYLQEGSTEEERQEYMPLIIKEVDRVNRIIEELLYFARPCNANFTLVDINNLLEQTLMLVKNSARNKAEFHLILARDLPLTEIDSEQFKQVFLNLVINSIQAIEGYGEITLITSLQDKETIRIEFMDTGIGINEHDLEKIFDPFYTTKETGTGLGLAVVQRIVMAHGGSVSIKSRPLGGTRVILQLPVKRFNGGNKHE